MPIYMKYEGIKGTVKEKTHEGWIELDSAQIGTPRTRSATRSSGAKPDSVPSVSEISVTKHNDVTSPNLFKQSLSGEGKKVTIDFVEINEGKPRVYLSLELEGVLISSYQISGGRGDEVFARPMETLSLNFTKITYSAKPAEVPKQGANKTNKSMWDIAMPNQP